MQKRLAWSEAALNALRIYGNMRARIVKALNEYAADQNSHANNVKALSGIPGKRLRIGDFRVIFEEDAEVISVTDIGPRGNIYD